MPTESRPPFDKCRLPASLLSTLSDRDRHLYEASDRAEQKLEWLIEHSLQKAEVLEEVRQQVRATNGRVLTAEADIRQLKETTAPVVKMHDLGRRLVGSKYFWVGAGLMVFVVFPWLVANAPAPGLLIKAAFTTLLGL